MRLILAFLAPLALLGQFKINQIRLIPTTDGAAVGQIEFDTTRADNKAIVLKAPTTATAGYTLTLPTAAPATNAECIVGTTAGVLSFVPCNSGAGTVTAANYDWTYTEGAEFTADLSIAGAQTVTVTPCPAGLPGQIYIAGGTGTAEVVTRTGGTCTNGAASGTLEFTTANTHTGAYTLSSATDGAQEYYSVLSADTCPVLDLGASSYEFRGTLTMSDCATIKSSPGATITAYDTDSPAIGAVYSGSAQRFFLMTGSLTINASGTHSAGSAAVYAEGWTDGGVIGLTCNSAYRCIDWYANNTGGGNPITIDKIRSSGTIDTVFLARSNGTGHTAGLVTNVYADGIAATGIKFQGQTAGWTVSNIWLQLINIGVSFEEVSTRTVNEMTLSGPCLIDGAQAAAVNITSSSSPGTNGIVVDGCFLAMDAGGIPVVLSGMQRVSIKNNWIRQTGANFAIAATDSDFLEISNNTINFENTSGAAFGIGLVTTASTDVTIKNNVIRRVTGAGTATGIVFQALSYSAVTHCGNRFYDITTEISDSSTAGVTICDTVPDTTPIVSGSADVTKLLRFELDGFTTATTRTLTPQDNSYIIAGLNIGQTFTAAQSIISGASGYSVPLTLQNNTVGLNGSCLTLAGHDGGVTVRELGQLCAIFDTAAFTDELVSLRTTTGAGTWEPAMTWKNDRTTAIGVFIAGSHIWADSPSANDIGDATNYFQTLHVENIDAAPSGVATAYAKVRKLEITDILGGIAFWDQRVNATSVTSNWTLRDNGGSRALQFVRQEASSPANYMRAFGEIRPALRATADGDAVNDSTLPTLGNTTDRWSAIWGDAATITNALTAGSVTAPTITATTAFSAGFDNVTPLGSSLVRLSKAWLYDLDAAGTVKLGTSSTVGQVWTATDTAGNGTWGAAGVTSARTISTTSPLTGGGDLSADRTFGCATCFTTAGGTISGAVTVAAGNLTVEGIRFSSGSTYTIGTSSARASNTFTDALSVYGSGEIKSGASLTAVSGSTVDFSGTVTTGGSATVSSTFSCGAGQAIKTLTVSRGLVTAATCGTP